MTYTIKKSIQRPPAQKIADLRDSGIGSSLGSLANVIGAESYLDPAIRGVERDFSFIGPAITVNLSEPDYIIPYLALELAEPGDVMVVAAHNQSKLHLWGPGLTRRASARGLAGVVLDGTYSGTRDIRAVNFPLFGRGPGPAFRKGHVPGSINVPVVCGGVLINPGDVVYGTEDGVMVIPPEKLDACIEAARYNTARWEEGKKQLAERLATLKDATFEERLEATGLVNHLAGMPLEWQD